MEFELQGISGMCKTSILRSGIPGFAGTILLPWLSGDLLAVWNRGNCPAVGRL